MKVSFAPFLLLVSSGMAGAAITINGLRDERVYTNRVTFEVEHDPSFNNQVLIDGEGASTGTPITIEKIGFHELVVTHFAPGTSEIVETETVHFIVRNSERGNSENGLPSWTPRPNVPASDAEINEGHFQLFVPFKTKRRILNPPPKVRRKDVSQSHQRCQNCNRTIIFPRPSFSYQKVDESKTSFPDCGDRHGHLRNDAKRCHDY